MELARSNGNGNANGRHAAGANGAHQPRKREVGDDRPITLALAFLAHAGFGKEPADWEPTAEDAAVARLRHWREEFFAFEHCVYRRVVPEELRSHVTRFLNGLSVPRMTQNKVPYTQKLRVTDSIVNETIKQMRALCQVFGVDGMPAWLDATTEGGRDRPDPSDVIAFQNGWLDAGAYARGEQHQPGRATPLWFSESALPCVFDPRASCPQWLRFLAQALGDDTESIDLLQEWAGYCLTGDTSLQKMLWLYGKAAAGKSTFTQVLAYVVGERNTVSFELWDFTNRFTLQTFLGKTLAISADAELSERGQDARQIIGQIKAIVGEDHRSVDRKNRDIIERVKLRTRLLLCVNRLPSLPSAGGALERRSLIVPFDRRFRGDKDTLLAEKLMSEAGGIVQWALLGLRRLRERGDFPVTKRAREMNERMAELSNPIPAFVEDCCDIQPRPLHDEDEHDELFWVTKKDLYDAYVAWSKQNQPGHPPEAMNRFCESIYDNTEAEPYRPRAAAGGEQKRPTALKWIKLNAAGSALAARTRAKAEPSRDEDAAAASAEYQHQQKEIDFAATEAAAAGVGSGS
jgi:P4 family phage/plasmid primase-like protien